MADTTFGIHESDSTGKLYKKVPTISSDVTLMAPTSSGVDGIPHYSTSEVDTGVKWTDGSKSIYRKTISTGAMPNATTKNVAHGISGMTAIVGWVWSADNGSTAFLPVGYADFNFGLWMYATDTNIVIVSNYNWSSLTNGYVTVWYIK
jgi:hypothetical protein